MHSVVISLFIFVAILFLAGLALLIDAVRRVISEEGDRS
jgi:hypothetical protein